MVSMNPLNNYRGQVAVFYALLVPVFLFLGGVGLDLGWYYLSVSRLQNAADAAVLVGANKLIEEHDTFKNKNYKARLVDKFPADNPARDSDSNLIDTTAGDEASLDYAKKNLADNSTAYAPPNFFSVAQAAEYQFKDGYTRGNPTVTLTPSLYKDDEDNYYYVLHLTENIHHFFIGFLDDMEAPVVAVALLSKNIDDSGGGDDDSPSELTLNFDANGGKFGDESTTASTTLDKPENMEDGTTTKPIVSGKGTPTNGDKIFNGWVTEPDKNGKVKYINDGKQMNKNELAAFFGDKTEITLYAVWKEPETPVTPVTPNDPPAVKPINNKTLWEQMQYLIAKNVYNDYWYAAKSKYGNKDPINSPFKYSKLYREPNNSSRAYYVEINTLSKSKIDSTDHYYIDFFQTYDVWFSSSYIPPASERSYYGNPYRIHSLINVDNAYEVRSSHKNKDDDPIYFRIEAEPYVSEYTPIRQIVINVNESNLANDKRPLFFYYDGPDARKDMSSNGSGTKILDPEAAQPVILNLNADFKGVLWMPDIPVVINGNGHNFEGFIVAKEYRYLDTTGLQVQYSSKGETNTTYSDNKIHVNPSTGDVYSIKATGNDAIEMYDNNARADNKFNLGKDSKFRTFHADSGVKYMYVYYGYDDNITMDRTPFYDEKGDLIPLYKLDEDGNQIRITKWEDVKLYNKAPEFQKNGNGKIVIDSKGNKTVTNGATEIPQSINSSNLRTMNTLTGNDYTLNKYKGSVILKDGTPAPLYDEAGNEVYFCEDYVKLTGTYEVFTLDRVADHTRDENKEFLLLRDDPTQSSTIISNTDDWK